MFSSLRILIANFSACISDVYEFSATPVTYDGSSKSGSTEAFLNDVAPGFPFLAMFLGC